MCIDPLSAASAALSVAGSVAGYSAARSQAAAQNQAYLDNARDANDAAGHQYAALAHRGVEERDAASQKLAQSSIDALKARSTARTAAGEAGVTGLSVEALLGDLVGQQGRRDETIRQNERTAQSDITAQMDMVKANTQSRIASVQRAQKPSALPFLIDGLSGTVKAFTPTGRKSV